MKLVRPPDFVIVTLFVLCYIITLFVFDLTELP